MKKFWYTIKKVQDTDSYEFLLANKKCTVNVKVFRTILDICPRVEGVDFTDVPDDDIALTFLVDLGYKGPLSRHTNMFVDHMHQPWRTLTIIINKYLSGKTTSNDKLRKSRIDILWGMFNRENVDYLELIWKDFAYQIDHKKEKRSRPVKIISDIHQIFNSSDSTHEEQGKCSKGRKTVDDSQEIVDVSKESKPKPKLAKKKTSSKRIVKKKVTLSADDNIISDHPDAALELAKSISQTKAKEAEVARKVHDTHARIVTESVLESAKKKSDGRSTKKQEAADIMQALKESKKTRRRKPGTRGSNEGTGSKLGVLNESIVVSATSSEGTGAKPRVPDEEKNITKEKVILEWGYEQDSKFSDDDNDDVDMDDKDGDADDEGDDHVSDIQDADDDDDETKSDEDEIYKYKIRVRKDEDVEMKDVEIEESDKGEEKVTDATKKEAEKTSKAGDDAKKTELPPSSSILSVSSGFGDQFLKLSSNSSLVSTIKDSTDIDRPPELTKKPTLTAKQESEKSPSEILKIKKEQAEKNPANHRLYHALMEALIKDENAMDKGVADTFKDYKRKHDDDEYDDDKDPPVGPNQGKKTKRGRTKESKSFKTPSTTKETLKGKTPTKDSKTSKSASTKETVEENIAKVIMDATGDDVLHDDDQSQDTLKPKTRKTLNPVWFNQPLRPPTPDPEWNKRHLVVDQPPQPWFKQMVYALKDPLTFNDLMTTPIDFSKYMLNGLKINNLTQDILLGPAFNLLKCTCSRNGDRYLFDLSNLVPLQGALSYRSVAADYFFNNDLEYLKTFDPEVTYTTTITKVKAARYEIKGINDVVPTLWSTIKHAYDKDLKRESNTGVKDTNCGTNLSVKKLDGYGHLEEIVVKRSYQELYKFKECDFVDLHLNDIEDMIFLVVQHKLFYLDGNVIVDFIVALRMFTGILILKRRVEDLQLGVKSYQKNLNITKHQKTFLKIEFKEPYTPSYDPPGIVYEDLDKQKRVLRADELYKFLDGTLKSVYVEIHHRLLNFCLDYNKEMPKRKWTAVDRKRSSLMIEFIDKKLREREIIKNLERLVGARELKMDCKLMTHTV
nr:hypothetical protein [Tanacetum cinerariifolium]